MPIISESGNLRIKRKDDVSARNEWDEYPDFTAEILTIEKTGITPELISRIINKHWGNSRYNRALFNRYKVLSDSVPIFNRENMYDEAFEQLNNKLNNDFFGEGIDFIVGYFAGRAADYTYSDTQESKEDTAELVSDSDRAVEIAKKAISDFVTRNNMQDIDMETTKNAACYGYSGRLFYIDTEGNERVTTVHGYNTIILSHTSICEPKYAIRYYKSYTPTEDYQSRQERCYVQFYDNKYCYYYEGGTFSKLEFIEQRLHMFDYCPLQGVPFNAEMQGTMEKVLSLIDDYDKCMSDNSNEIEGNANSKLVFENLSEDLIDRAKAQKSGVIEFWNGAGDSKVYYLTRTVNDTHIQNHLDRVEKDIYKFSKTPNLSDDFFNSASGIALKFKILGIETKCSTFESKKRSADTYMFKLLASAWKKKNIMVEPLQCYVTYKRNFPFDVSNEADAVNKLITAGFPLKEAIEVAMTCVDDADYIVAAKEEEQNAAQNIDFEEDTELLLDEDAPEQEILND